MFVKRIKNEIVLYLLCAVLGMVASYFIQDSDLDISIKVERISQFKDVHEECKSTTTTKETKS